MFGTTVNKIQYHTQYICIIVNTLNTQQNNTKKTAQSNLGKGHVGSHTFAQLCHKLQPGYNEAPHICPKITPPVDRSPNSTTCLIPGSIRPTIPNYIQIWSAVLPQCTRQIDTQTNRWSGGIFYHYWPLLFYRQRRHGWITTDDDGLKKVL